MFEAAIPFRNEWSLREYLPLVTIGGLSAGNSPLLRPFISKLIGYIVIILPKRKQKQVISDKAVQHCTNTKKINDNFVGYSWKDIKSCKIWNSSILIGQVAATPKAWSWNWSFLSFHFDNRRRSILSHSINKLQRLNDLELNQRVFVPSSFVDIAEFIDNFLPKL